MRLRAACVLLGLLDHVAKRAIAAWWNVFWWKLRLEIRRDLDQIAREQAQTLPDVEDEATPAVSRFRARHLRDGRVLIEPEDERVNCWSTRGAA